MIRNILDKIESGLIHAKGGKGGGGGGQSTVQKADPWSGQQPYLKKGFAEAERVLLDQDPTYFPGSTVAEFTPDTEQAMGMIRQEALQGSELAPAAQQNLIGTLQGENLYGGEGFNAALDAASRRILPQVDSAFAKAGRYGSGLAKTAQTQALADAFASQYGQERQRQMQAATLTPQVDALRFEDAKALGGIGETQYGLEQAKIGEDIARHNFGQNIRQDQLARYMNAIQGNYGGTSTSTTQGPQANKTSAALGGALGGAAMGASVGGPWGAAIGGGLGLLSGFM